MAERKKPMRQGKIVLQLAVIALMLLLYTGIIYYYSYRQGHRDQRLDSINSDVTASFYLLGRLDAGDTETVRSGLVTILRGAIAEFRRSTKPAAMRVGDSVDRSFEGKIREVESYLGEQGKTHSTAEIESSFRKQQENPK